ERLSAPRRLGQTPPDVGLVIGEVARDHGEVELAQDALLRLVLEQEEEGLAHERRGLGGAAGQPLVGGATQRHRVGTARGAFRDGYAESPAVGSVALYHVDGWHTGYLGSGDPGETIVDVSGFRATQDAGASVLAGEAPQPVDLLRRPRVHREVPIVR